VFLIPRSIRYCLGSDFGVLGHLWIKMMSLFHCWGWQPPQTASHKHIKYIQRVCRSSAYSSSIKQIHPHYLAQMLGYVVTCGVKMMSLHHCWGWQPPQTAFCYHIRHIQSVWDHWNAVHQHTVAALNSYTHTTWLRLWGSGSLVESSWCHYVMVKADIHLKLLPGIILDIYKVSEHINMLSISIW